MSALVGLLLGGSWLFAAWVGYRVGLGDGRHDERMASLRAALDAES